MASAGLAQAHGALAGQSFFKSRYAHSNRTGSLRLPALIGSSPLPHVMPCCAAFREEARPHLESESTSQPAVRSRRKILHQSGAYGKGSRRKSSAIAAQATEQAQSDAAERSKEDKRAHLSAHREESHDIQELDRPLSEYMSLPASQYSVLDAERIERVDDKTFKCYVHRLKFFTFEVCPVLLVRVDEKPNGCSIRLLSCTLEGSPLVVAQNQKFSASMVNNVRWSDIPDEPTRKQLISDTTIDVSIEVPAPFRSIPVEGIEMTGRKVLQQLLRLVLPRFLLQLEKDYRAWASGDESRKPLGTGEL